MFQIFIMNDFKNSRFRSYIQAPGELQNIPLRDDQRAKLLEGELAIAEVENVILYTSLSEPRTYKKGIITVTNFKLSFIPSNENEEYIGVQQNFMLKPYETCLSCIDVVYQLGEKTRRKLILGHSISSKVKELQIVCKNMRIFHFSFLEANKDKVKNLVNAILHHAAPKRLSLLFAFDYRDRFGSANNLTSKDIQWFQKANDWVKELERTKTSSSQWRICRANEYFQISLNLPQVCVVPASVEDHMLTKAAEHFQSYWTPVWVWGTSRTALVRMADLDPRIQDRTQENIMLEHIRKSHSSLLSPFIIDLAKDFPSHKELQTSFLKLRDLCNPGYSRLFKQQDNKFYSQLENTKWLQYVSLCLSNAVIGASKLADDATTVVLQEGTGRDMNCIVSCLIQLMLDVHWRTIRGFQSLIQKEWIVLSHPFTKRLGLVDGEVNEAGPYFLLFLDCTWQLLQQYPSAFQFSETYLATLWDTVHITIFDTFLFNSEHERDKAKKNNKSASFLSAWDYSRQFPENDINLFCNPLYDDSFLDRLYPRSTVPFLDVWRQCYFRWLSGVEIVKGGPSQIDLSCRILALEILALQQTILLNSGEDGSEVNGRQRYNQAKEDAFHLLQKVNSFFPFSRNDGHPYGLLPGNDLLSLDAQDSQSLLNLTNE